MRELTWTTITVALWCAIALAVVLVDRRVMLATPIPPETSAIPTTSEMRASTA